MVSFYVFIFFFVSLFCLQSFPPVVGDLTLIKQTCKKNAKTDPNVNYNFCVSAFESFPGSLAADLKGLGVISVKLAVANAKDTRSYINDQLKHNKTMDPATREGMSACSELYSEAVSNLRDAVKNMKSKSYREANLKISAGMDDSSTCDDGFSVSVSSPMKDRNTNLFQLCAIALSFAV